MNRNCSRSPAPWKRRSGLRKYASCRLRIYAGKIVAALDRQHPRDLFDVRDLLANEGIDETLRRAFLVYLLSHNRPIFEVLAPKRKSITAEFGRGFKGMTAEPISIDELTSAGESLIDVAVGKMPEQHRRFLLSFERGKPEWPLLELPGSSAPAQEIDPIEEFA